MKIPDPEFAIGYVFNKNIGKGTYDVRFIDNQGIQLDVPVLGTSSSGLSNDVSLATSISSSDTCVLLIRVCYKWYILCTIPVEDSGEDGTSVSATNTGTGGDNKITYGKNVGKPGSYVSGRSTDVLSGDKRIVADGGSEVLLGKEGLVVLKASTLSQIILGAYKNFARIVAREFELFTDFGTVRFTGGGKEGVTGMAIMGGGNFADESSTIEPAYPVHMYLGEVPWDVLGRFAMQVDSPDGSQHMRREIDINGNQETYVSKALVDRSMFRKTVVEDSEEHLVLSSQYTKVGLDKNEEFPAADEADLRDSCKPLSELKEMPVGLETAAMGAGDNFTEIVNNEAISVGGEQTTNVASHQTEQVGGNKSTYVNGKILVSASGNIDESSGGNITETAADNKILNANKLVLNIGSLTINGASGTLKLNSPINITYTAPAPASEPETTSEP